MNMKTYPLASDTVELEVTEIGGMLGGVTFDLGGRRVAPMHIAPWADAQEVAQMGEDVPPMLRVLRGDFLAAPFGDSDLLTDEQRPHGLTANGRWLVRGGGEGRLELELDGSVMGARVRKSVALRNGETVVYQRDVFTGGSGRLPIGHHAMLRARAPLRLSFAPWRWAGTPPEPVERAPRGRSALLYPQTITDLRQASLADGGTTDLTRYPVLDGFEDLWMLVAEAGREVGWTAAVCEAEGWVWFALKDSRVLPSTMMWLSNGGRDYPPFSGRHHGVIGLEEICSSFHLGHRASTLPNMFTRMGVPTSVELSPERPLSVSYLFGLAAVPAGFGAVRDVQVEDGGVALLGDGDVRIEAACDVSFLFGGELPPA